jgi:hypothetical protein
VKAKKSKITEYREKFLISDGSLIHRMLKKLKMGLFRDVSNVRKNDDPG